MNLPIGTLLQGGKYKIVEKLGQGTFGITYHALVKMQGDLGALPFHVAIKEFFMKEKNERSSDGSVTCSRSSADTCEYYRKKFRHEAENLSKMRHDNIVKVSSIFDENNTTYYVMELVSGMPLDKYIARRHGLPEGEALRIFREACSAVSYMHGRRMLHLDIKPNNIMRSNDGHIFMIDFGLSKQFNKNGEPESSTSIGLGTNGYAPPEQSGYKQDGSFPATLDVYALGGTLYKMLTGFTPPSSSDIINDGLDRQPLEKKNVSKATIAVIEKAMQQKKADRYQTVQKMLSALPFIEEEIDEEPEVINTSEAPSEPNNGKEEPDTNPILSVDELMKLADRYRSEQNYEKAFKLYSKCYEKDNNNYVCACNLGSMYYNGWGTPRRYEMAFNLFSKAAEHGVKTAQRNLGRCYEYGHGCKADINKAKEWYRKAMNQGDEKAKDAYKRLNVHKKSSLKISGTAIALAVFVLGIVSLIAINHTPTFTDNQITDGIINDHGYVDLGLSVKWATCNMEGVHIDDSKEYVSGYVVYISPESADEMNKSITSEYPFPIVRSGDFAEQYWGADFWRVPTKEEFEELINKCDWKWGKLEGVYGYKVTGPNGKSMFLPAVGYESEYRYEYWCINFESDEKPKLFSLSFNESTREIRSSTKDMHCAVRAVAK